MAAEDEYLSISDPAFGEYREKGSKFLAYAHPMREIEDFSTILEAVKSEHPKARHHCFAYRLGNDGLVFRASDDGEPSGTAGRPILGQIDSFQLSDVAVVVVRYFGGTKLGASGLIHAYKTATQAALQEASISTRRIMTKYELQFDYSLMPSVMNAVKKVNATVISQDFNESGSMIIGFPKSEAPEHLLRLKAIIAEVSIQHMRDAPVALPGLKIKDLV